MRLESAHCFVEAGFLGGDTLGVRFLVVHAYSGASQVALVVKSLPSSAEDLRDGFDPWVRKIPWGRAWQPTPVFWPGEFHGQRSLVGYSPQGRKESDTAERLTVSYHTIK